MLPTVVADLIDQYEETVLEIQSDAMDELTRYLLIHGEALREAVTGIYIYL